MLADSASRSVGLIAHNVVDRDGQGRAMVELARALAERGHAVTVYSRTLAEDLRERVTHRRLPRPVGIALVDDLVLFAAATRAVNRAHHDVVVQIGPVCRPRAPFVYEVQFSHHGWKATWDATSTPSRYHRAHAALALAMERRILPRSAAVMPTTTRLGHEVLAGCGLLDAPGAPQVVVVPNGVDVDRFAPATPEARAEARARLGIEDEMVVGFLGEYHTGRKGLEPLVDAVGSLPGVHLVVGGSGDETSIAARVAAAGVDGRVHLLGFVNQEEVLSVADVVCVPSRYEPFSLVALEAAACGAAVVLSATVGAVEHLGDSALVVDDPTDPTALADALRVYADDRERRRTDGARARRAAQRLAWSAVMVRAVELIESIADEAPKAAVDRQS